MSIKDHKLSTIITYGWWNHVKANEFNCIAEVYKPMCDPREVGITLTRENTNGSVRWSMACENRVVVWNTSGTLVGWEQQEQDAHRQAEAHTSNYLMQERSV